MTKGRFISTQSTVSPHYRCKIGLTLLHQPIFVARGLYGNNLVWDNLWAQSSNSNLTEDGKLEEKRKGRVSQILSFLFFEQNTTWVPGFAKYSEKLVTIIYSISEHAVSFGIPFLNFIA